MSQCHVQSTLTPPSPERLQCAIHTEADEAIPSTIRASKTKWMREYENLCVLASSLLQSAWLKAFAVLIRLHCLTPLPRKHSTHGTTAYAEAPSVCAKGPRQMPCPCSKRPRLPKTLNHIYWGLKRWARNGPSSRTPSTIQKILPRCGSALRISRARLRHRGACTADAPIYAVALTSSLAKDESHEASGASHSEQQGPNSGMQAIEKSRGCMRLGHHKLRLSTFRAHANCKDRHKEPHKTHPDLLHDAY